MRGLKPRLLLVGLIALLAGGCTRPVALETVAAQRRTVVESFVEQAETRLSRTWTVTMPESGTISRMHLEVGDRVSRGQHLVAFDRVPQESAASETANQVHEAKAQLDLNERLGVEDSQRSVAEAQKLEAQRSVQVAQTEVTEAEARDRQAQVDLQRYRRLVAQDAVPVKSLEDARLTADVARTGLARARRQLQAQRAELRAAGERVRTATETIRDKTMRNQVLQSEVAQAEARQHRMQHDVQQAVVVSPVDGEVLERYQQGPGPLGVGEKLVLLGRRSDMEAFAEVLTEDAVSLHPGSAVTMQATSGGPVLSGHVKRTEPQAFTKLSALGVEQKRVRVIIALDHVPPEIGVGYRLEARFVTRRKDNVLTVPRFAVVQQPDRSFFVYRIAGGRLEQQPVELGAQEDLYVEVTRGVREGDRVVAAPDPSYRVGMPATPSP